MALWMSALKVIPWGDVIEAAPGIVKGARKMFARTQANEAVAEAAAAVADTNESAPHLRERISQLEASLAQMAEQQQASAQLIESLAEQNAKVVQAIDILRVRTRLLLFATGALFVALIGLAAWSLR